ncbi:hypothetical protein SLS58_004634 [Diplodia intermedia]|uniref:Uncharacterized protein n=1 Tax=Diplodia intermedia TaxID=856260 RepID=A0ABR3TT94_9PEZI
MAETKAEGTAPLTDHGEEVEASAAEILELCHVRDGVPRSAWAVALVGAAERLTFYGITAPFQNYLQHGQRDGSHGGLALSQSAATNIVNAFNSLVSIAPIAAGAMADARLGRYRTLVGSVM